VAALRFELIDAPPWGRKPLGDLLLKIDGGRSPVTEGRPPTDGERGVLKLSAVRPGRFEQLEAKALSDDTPMPQSALVSIGDVLITRSNTPQTVGAV
jgi:type I restriction enzyme S subunit